MLDSVHLGYLSPRPERLDFLQGPDSPLIPSYANAMLLSGSARPTSSILFHEAAVVQTIEDAPDTELLAPSIPDQLVVIQVLDRRPRQHTDLTGRRRTFDINAGTFLVVPPGQQSWWRTEGAGGRLLHIMIRASAIPVLCGGEQAGTPLEPKVGWSEPALAMIARLLAEELETPRNSKLYRESIAVVAVAQIVRALEKSVAARGFRGGLTPRTLRRVQDYILANLSRDITVSELAALADLSPFHFCRAFKQSTGAPPHAWLTARRIEHAQVLMSSDGSVGLTDVALSVGFGGHAAFSTAFRRVVGCTPSVWRRERLG
jgi:AraC family transcriptional regulator